MSWRDVNGSRTLASAPASKLQLKGYTKTIILAFFSLPEKCYYYYLVFKH
jgi:hypothetical protein